jgi:NAD(P)-dependent dehydrogenase (short-subunit alcohol dehydrogenase family)
LEKEVCVITGGGSGIGFATAMAMAKGATVVIAGRTEAKLVLAAERLRAEGIDAHSCACDVADGESVSRLASFAAGLGGIGKVIHSAGLSPNMGDAATIMKTNVLGSINVDEAFLPLMGAGTCMVHVASMAAYVSPKLILPRRSYPLCRKDTGKFMRRMMGRLSLFPKNFRSSLAYLISKDFMIWYARTEAARFGEKGVRIFSVSPGNFNTPMGDMEREAASRFIPYSALNRFGRVEEIAQLIVACAERKVGYLTGTDILCDGGLVASGFNFFTRMRS